MGETIDKIVGTAGTLALGAFLGATATIVGVNNSQGFRDAMLGDRWVTGKVTHTLPQDYVTSQVPIEVTTKDGQKYYGLAEYRDSLQSPLPREGQDVRIHLGHVMVYSNVKQRKVLEFEIQPKQNQ